MTTRTQRKWIFLVAAALFSPMVQAWIPQSRPAFAATFVSFSRDSSGNDLTSDPSNKQESSSSSSGKELLTTSNPCWEDIYDDDCAMSNVHAASFVASEWIKSMPCGANLEDCDMPQDLTVPETRPEAGVEQVDVMKFLGLKRAAPVDKPDVKP